ncbi:MAG: ComF family protein [Bacteroides sp.]|nr:ComF family protein [Bacteroides sp.]
MGAVRQIKQWLSDLLNLIYPRLCEVCGTTLVEGEELICVDCDFNMPRCNIHENDFNFMHKRLLRNVHIERAAAYFSYSRGSRYTELILSAKYRNRPIIARQLAARFATEIKDSGFFDDIDIILPVPMHYIKKRKRGFNQTEIIADGLKEITAIEIGTNLTATRGHDTQTRKSAVERWKNARDIYDVDAPESLNGKHILVVDDVMTTGATISACCEALQNRCQNIRISVLTLAATINI